MEYLSSKPLLVCLISLFKWHSFLNYLDTQDPIQLHTSAVSQGKPSLMLHAILTFDVLLPSWMSHHPNTGVDSTSHPERCACHRWYGCRAVCLSAWQLYDHSLLFKVRQNKAGKKNRRGGMVRLITIRQREGANKVKKNNPRGRV